VLLVLLFSPQSSVFFSYMRQLYRGLLDFTTFSFWITFENELLL